MTDKRQATSDKRHTHSPTLPSLITLILIECFLATSLLSSHALALEDRVPSWAAKKAYSPAPGISLLRQRPAREAKDGATKEIRKEFGKEDGRNLETLYFTGDELLRFKELETAFPNIVDEPAEMISHAKTLTNLKPKERLRFEVYHRRLLLQSRNPKDKENIIGILTNDHTPERLIRLLESSDVPVKRFAVTSLRDVTLDPVLLKEAVTRLEKMISDQSKRTVDVRRDAIFTLSELDPSRPNAYFQAIVEGENEKPLIRWAAKQVLKWSLEDRDKQTARDGGVRSWVQAIRNGGGNWKTENEILKIFKALEKKRIITEQAMDQLARLGSPAVPALVTILSEDEDSMRQWVAARVLGKIGDSSVVPYLGDAALNGKGWNVRQAAIGSMEKIGDSGAIPYLIPFLNGDDRGMRLASIKALGNMGPSAIPHLVRPLRKDKDWMIRQYAAESLGEIGHPDVMKPLISARWDGNELVREAVIRALGKTGDPRVVPYLVQAQKDRVQEVRVAAIKALRKMRPPSLSDEPDEEEGPDGFSARDGADRFPTIALQHPISQDRLTFRDRLQAGLIPHGILEKEAFLVANSLARYKDPTTLSLLEQERILPEGFSQLLVQRTTLPSEEAFAHLASSFQRLKTDYQTKGLPLNKDSLLYRLIPVSWLTALEERHHHRWITLGDVTRIVMYHPEDPEGTLIQKVEKRDELEKKYSGEEFSDAEIWHFVKAYGDPDRVIQEVLQDRNKLVRDLAEEKIPISKADALYFRIHNPKNYKEAAKRAFTIKNGLVRDFGLSDPDGWYYAKHHPKNPKAALRRDLAEAQRRGISLSRVRRQPEPSENSQDGGEKKQEDSNKALGGIAEEMAQQGYATHLVGHTITNDRIRNIVNETLASLPLVGKRESKDEPPSLWGTSEPEEETDDAAFTILFELLLNSQHAKPGKMLFAYRTFTRDGEEFVEMVTRNLRGTIRDIPEAVTFDYSGTGEDRRGQGLSAIMIRVLNVFQGEVWIESEGRGRRFSNPMQEPIQSMHVYQRLIDAGESFDSPITIGTQITVRIPMKMWKNTVAPDGGGRVESGRVKDFAEALNQFKNDETEGLEAWKREAVTWDKSTAQEKFEAWNKWIETQQDRFKGWGQGIIIPSSEEAVALEPLMKRFLRLNEETALLFQGYQLDTSRPVGLAHIQVGNFYGILLENTDRAAEYYHLAPEEVQQEYFNREPFRRIREAYRERYVGGRTKPIADINLKSGERVHVYQLDKTYAKVHAGELVSLFNQIEGVRMTEERLLADAWREGRREIVLYGKWAHSLVTQNDEGKIVALRLAEEIAADDIAWIEQNGLYGYAIAVSPEYRQQGLAESLLKLFAERALRTGLLYLDNPFAPNDVLIWGQMTVQPYENTAMLSLAKKLGYERVGSREYPDRVDDMYQALASTILSSGSEHVTDGGRRAAPLLPTRRLEDALLYP